MTITSEKQLCNHLEECWNLYFEGTGIHFGAREFSIDIIRPRVKSRIDFFAWRLKPNKFRIPMMIEVKFGTKSSRDLIFELEKLLLVKGTRHNQMKNPEFEIIVLADILDEPTQLYMKKHDITWLKYIILDADEVEDGRLLKITRAKL